MNITEKKAYAWLLAQGINHQNIHFQQRDSPDFILSDGQGFEVKRIRNSTIYLGKNQFNQLKAKKECKVLAYSEKDENPIIIPTSEIEPETIVSGIRIIVDSKTYLEKGEFLVRVSDDILEALRKKYPELKELNNKALVDVVLRKLLKEAETA